MTRPIPRKMAIDCLLWYFATEADAGLCCYLCDNSLGPEQDIQFDHIHAIIHGGPHEYENLRPVHAECHKKKTARDVAANAKVKRLLADKPSRRPMKSAGRKIPSRQFSKRTA